MHTNTTSPDGVASSHNASHKTHTRPTHTQTHTHSLCDARGRLDHALVPLVVSDGVGGGVAAVTLRGDHRAPQAVRPHCDEHSCGGITHFRHVS